MMFNSLTFCHVRLQHLQRRAVLHNFPKLIDKSGLGLSRPAKNREGGETVNGTNELCPVSAASIEGLADETIQCETRRIPAAGTQSVANQARCGLIVK